MFLGLKSKSQVYFYLFFVFFSIVVSALMVVSMSKSQAHFSWPKGKNDIEIEKVEIYLSPSLEKKLFEK